MPAFGPNALRSMFDQMTDISDQLLLKWERQGPNIRYQLVTFLIAGHETTSGLLTFTIYELLRHPEVMEQARAEVDRVLGEQAPRFEHLAGLGYLDQVLKETLRLWPTAPAFALEPYAEQTTLGGRYTVHQGQTLLVLTPALHRDPAVWGADPERFDPDRFAFANAEQLPPNAWKPFGNGQRSCIGRGFALQEATLFLAMLLQRFGLSAADPDYQLSVKETLTMKPEGLFIHAHRRDTVVKEPARGAASVGPHAAPAASKADGIPLRILFGSNAGTSEAFAQRIANDARLRGYTPDLDTLDSAVGHLPTEGAVIIVTASYEGQPPDVEIALPEGSNYRAGDYLAVLPTNPAATVDRALSRFDLAYDSQAVIKATEGVRTFLPTNQPITAGELLASHVELSLPATRHQVEQLALTSSCPPEQESLRALIATDTAYTTGVLDQRVSVLDLLERHPSCQLPFAAFLHMLNPLAPRQYSISSFPWWSGDHCTVTVAVVSAPALSGAGTYEGAASTYLAHARPGTKIAVTVRPSNVAFHPPESLAVPVVMVCAGTGLAPFRGFLQDRALRAEQEGTVPAPALLFFGCDHPDVDYLYRDELARWSLDEIVSVRPAYSAAPEDGIRYVQDRLWADRAEVVELVQQGAVFYVCGDGQRMTPAVHDTCARIYQEATGATHEQADVWITEMQREHGRYVTDVFT